MNEKHVVGDSGITLTKLVGVMVLCFARSEIFVVRAPKFVALCSSWSLARVNSNGCVGAYRCTTSKCTWLWL